MSEFPLQTPVQFVPGVGPARAELLGRLEIETVEDLLWHLPRRILDLSEVRPVSELDTDTIQTVQGVVVDRESRKLRGGRSMTAVLLSCQGEYARGVWFNQPWMLGKLPEGQTVLFSGKPKRKSGRWEFSHPRVQWLEEDAEAQGEVLPVYGLTDGLKMHDMRRIMGEAVDIYIDNVVDSLPTQFREKFALPDLVSAIRSIHRPESASIYDAACRRLIFEDLLEFQIGLALRRRAWNLQDSAPNIECTGKIDARIRRLFPFRFTSGQDQAIREICNDLASGRAMHRMLQADVGAGKTVIALYAMLAVLAQGYQAVLLAPTEILAQQHWATVETILAKSRVKRVLITGKLTAAQRKSVLSEVSSGDAQLVVGTHAVIQQDVAFTKLGLAVIDEQQKFGVAQRSHFSTNDATPHVLFMSATPIPRSVAMTIFGDLEMSIVSELPPGRQRVVTSRIYSRETEQKAWSFVRKSLIEGRQVFIVCPRIAGSSESEEVFDPDEELSGNAEEVYRKVSAEELKGFSVGLVHGQMAYSVREEAMQAFRRGEIQALVATTVVEVGVDVPNATLMVILEAERFGLSQLHQLRGRISRGEFQGYCFLFSNSTSDEAVKRLAAMESTSDGFKIAETDFELRGPGDVLGTRQHGRLPLRVADLVRDREILDEARLAAFDLVDSETIDQAEYAPLKIRVLERFEQLMDLNKSG